MTKNNATMTSQGGGGSAARVSKTDLGNYNNLIEDSLQKFTFHLFFFK